jgi:hypothetical protein
VHDPGASAAESKSAVALHTLPGAHPSGRPVTAATPSMASTGAGQTHGGLLQLLRRGVGEVEAHAVAAGAAAVRGERVAGDEGHALVLNRHPQHLARVHARGKLQPRRTRRRRAAASASWAESAPPAPRSARRGAGGTRGAASTAAGNSSGAGSPGASERVPGRAPTESIVCSAHVPGRRAHAARRSAGASVAIIRCCRAVPARAPPPRRVP